MQGIQIAKEMAQQELSSQKAAYESRIRALEAELVRSGICLFSDSFLECCGAKMDYLQDGA